MKLDCRDSALYRLPKLRTSGKLVGFSRCAHIPRRLQVPWYHVPCMHGLVSRRAQLRGRVGGRALPLAHAHVVDTRLCLLSLSPAPPPRRPGDKANACSAMADLSMRYLVQASLCSFRRVSSLHFVSPMYTLPQVHGTS